MAESPTSATPEISRKHLITASQSRLARLYAKQQGWRRLPDGRSWLTPDKITVFWAYMDGESFMGLVNAVVYVVEGWSDESRGRRAHDVLRTRRDVDVKMVWL